MSEEFDKWFCSDNGSSDPLVAWKARGEHDSTKLEEAKQRIAQLQIDNADLHANLAESNTWLAEANAEITRLQNKLMTVNAQYSADKEALEKKLAEQQSLMKIMLDIVAAAGAPTLANKMRDLNEKCGTEELTKREAAARAEGFEEGKKAVIKDLEAAKLDALSSYSDGYITGKQAGRDELQKVPRIPQAINAMPNLPEDEAVGFINGFNACRNMMLAAAPQPPRSE